MICSAAVLVLFLYCPAHADTSSEVVDVASDAVVRLREAAVAVRGRAAAIAAVRSVGYAVATDQQTTLDMTADELSVHAQPGELVPVAITAASSQTLAGELDLVARATA